MHRYKQDTVTTDSWRRRQSELASEGVLRVCLLGKDKETPFQAEASARVEVQGRPQHGVLGDSRSSIRIRWGGEGAKRGLNAVVRA